MSNKSTAKPLISIERGAANYWLRIFLLLYIYPVINGLVSLGNETRLAADFLAYCFLPLLILVILKSSKKSAFDELVGELRTSVRGVLISVVIGYALAYTLYSFADIAYRYFSNAFPRSEYWLQLFRSEHGLFYVTYLATTAGFVEEFLYKAMLYRAVVGSRFESPTYFAILSAMLFGISHQEQGIAVVLVYTFWYGLPSALYYLRTRNIANLIVIHVVADVFIFGWAWAYA